MERRVRSRRSLRFRRVVLALAASSCLATISVTALAQQRPTPDAAAIAAMSPNRLRQEVTQARGRAARDQQSALAAIRNNSPTRANQLEDWRQSIEAMRPLVARLDASVPADAQLLADFRAMNAQYADVAGLGNQGTLMLAMQERWARMTRDGDGWREEPLVTPATATQPSDAAAGAPLRMPKTVAFVRGANAYLRDVERMPAYPFFADAPGVASDVRQTVAARDEAESKLMTAIDARCEAAQTSLKEADRDAFETFVERDVRGALAGSPRQAAVVARGEAIVDDFNRRTVGEERAAEMARDRDARTADVRWQSMLDRLAPAALEDPAAARRGQVVILRDAHNALGDRYKAGNADLAAEVKNTPVVLHLDPALKKKYDAAKKSSATTAGTTFDAIGIIDGPDGVDERVSAQSIAARAVTRPDNPGATVELPNRAATSRLVRTEGVGVRVIGLRMGSLVLDNTPPPATQPAATKS